MATAITGGFWRFIYIPSNVLRRTIQAQRGWVTWRVRSHYKESGGKCHLFGDITGYLWFPSPDESFYLDSKGQVTHRERMAFEPVMGSVSLKNKQIAVSKDGRASISVRVSQHES